MPLAQRLFTKFEVDSDSGCWVWTASTRSGYGQIWSDADATTPRRLLSAHRAVWELVRGPIPENLQVDHLCRNRLCVNPEHLELVTQRENILRGEAPAAINARKTHCGAGHQLTPRPGDPRRRWCAICQRAATTAEAA